MSLRNNLPNRNQPSDWKVNKVQKPRQLNVWEIGLILGIISSVIGICAYITGVPSIPDMFSGVTRTPRPTTTPAPTVYVVPTNTFQPLRKGVTTVLLDASNQFSVAFSFQTGTVAMETAPVDLQISNCLLGLADLTLYCDLKATDISLHSNTSLDALMNVPNSGDGLFRSPLTIGDSYTLLAFDGRPAKFRIANKLTSYGPNSFLSISLVIEFAYDPNEGPGRYFRGN
ncbi:hypothetical protein IH575_00835 [Candidatus Dojkabacteria bacterium]|nr:hypothetical protein [Candidatus Dojkabacteria bacterium]